MEIPCGIFVRPTPRAGLKFFYRSFKHEVLRYNVVSKHRHSWGHAIAFLIEARWACQQILIRAEEKSFTMLPVFESGGEQRVQIQFETGKRKRADGIGRQPEDGQQHELLPEKVMAGIGVGVSHGGGGFDSSLGDTRHRTRSDTPRVPAWCWWV